MLKECVGLGFQIFRLVAIIFMIGYAIVNLF